MRVGVIAALVVSLMVEPAAFGAPKRASARPRTRVTSPEPAPAATAAPPPVVPSRPQVPDFTSLSTAELVKRVHAATDALEYDDAVRLVDATLKRHDLDLEQQIDMYMLSGQALVVLERPLDAEQPFRLLLRLQLDYEPAATTPPKALAVFRKVQAEEKVLAAEIAARARRKLLESIALDCTLPAEARGGLVLDLHCGLVDPERAVDGVVFRYRRRGEHDYNGLALVRDAGGAWDGALPGEWTQNDHGVEIELYAVPLDRNGDELVTPGSVVPSLVAVSPGSVSDARPFYRSPWFWTATATAVIAAGVGSYFLYKDLTKLPAHDVGPYAVP